MAKKNNMFIHSLSFFTRHKHTHTHTHTHRIFIQRKMILEYFLWIWEHPQFAACAWYEGLIRKCVLVCQRGKVRARARAHAHTHTHTHTHLQERSWHLNDYLVSSWGLIILLAHSMNAVSFRPVYLNVTKPLILKHHLIMQGWNICIIMIYMKSYSCRM